MSRLGVEGLGRLEVVEERGMPVHVAQAQEVGREAPEPGPEGPDERVRVVDAQQGIGRPLVADGAGRRLSRSGCAERPCAVGGPQRGGPRKLAESLHAAELLS
jgi:hypothetical protein